MRPEPERPSHAAVEARLRVAVDELVEAGILAVGWPFWRDMFKDSLDLVGRLDGIDDRDAERMLSTAVGYRVVLLTETPGAIRESGTVISRWIYRTPGVDPTVNLSEP